MHALKIPVLFAQNRSSYFNFPDLFDVYDAEKNALTFEKRGPIIAHPPCRLWSQMRGMANWVPAEKWYFPWSIGLVRRYGGIVEHPRSSSGWAKYCGQALRFPEQYDNYGGFLLFINQFDFGLPFNKPTGLYIVGANKNDLPPIPLNMDARQYIVLRSTLSHKLGLKEASKKMRSHTPDGLKFWMYEVCRSIEVNKAALKLR